MRVHISSLLIGGIVAVGAFAVRPPAFAAEKSEGAGGQVVCRAEHTTEGTFELVLEWQGEVGKGALKRVAPSGNVYLTRLRAERRGTTIIADDVHEKDLVVHAAIVHEENGKRYMRAGDDKQPWMLCK